MGVMALWHGRYGPMAWADDATAWALWSYSMVLQHGRYGHTAWTLWRYSYGPYGTTAMGPMALRHGPYGTAAMGPMVLYLYLYLGSVAYGIDI